MKTTAVIVLMLLAAGARSALAEPRFRLVPCERPTPRSCIEVEKRGEGKVVAFYDERGTIVREIELKLPCNSPVVSKNKRNVVIREPVGECDIMARYRLHLYDVRGDLVGTSEPMMLYDLYVEPMGNDSTVLVIYPAVEVPSFSITFLQARGGQLYAANRVTGSSSGLEFDVAQSGDFLVVVASLPSESKMAEVRLVGADGTTAWTTQLDEVDTAPGLSISPLGKYIVVSSADYERRQRYANLLAADGSRIGKTPAGWEGTLKAFFPADGEESHVLISSGRWIRLFEARGLRPVLSLDESASFVSMLLSGACHILAVTSDHLVAVGEGGNTQEIRLPLLGSPSLHQVHDTTYLAIESMGSTRWFRLQEGHE